MGMQARWQIAWRVHSEAHMVTALGSVHHPSSATERSCNAEKHPLYTHTGSRPRTQALRSCEVQRGCTLVLHRCPAGKHRETEHRAFSVLAKYTFWAIMIRMRKAYDQQWLVHTDLCLCNKWDTLRALHRCASTQQERLSMALYHIP